MKDFQNQIDSKWESYMISVDSVMCVKTKSEVIDLFNNIQDFLIEKNFKDIFELSSRSVYSSGKYYYQSRGVYAAHLKKFFTVCPLVHRHSSIETVWILIRRVHVTRLH